MTHELHAFMRISNKLTSLQSPAAGSEEPASPTRSKTNQPPRKEDQRGRGVSRLDQANQPSGVAIAGTAAPWMSRASSLRQEEDDPGNVVGPGPAGETGLRHGGAIRFGVEDAGDDGVDTHPFAFEVGRPAKSIMATAAAFEATYAAAPAACRRRLGRRYSRWNRALLQHDRNHSPAQRIAGAEVERQHAVKTSGVICQRGVPPAYPPTALTRTSMRSRTARIVAMSWLVASGSVTSTW